jgi:hypothetical protein
MNYFLGRSNQTKQKNRKLFWVNERFLFEIEQRKFQKKIYFYKERESKAALKLEFAFGFKLITTEQVQDFGENRLKRWS